jgi:hypothetical protein
MPHKLTINHARNLAASRDGHCLSETYLNNSAPLRWECRKNHIWTASYCSVKNGTWCPDCSGKTKHTQEYVEEFIRHKGGQCLSVYENSKIKLKIKCEFLHEFNMKFNDLQQGIWCPECGGTRKHTQEEIENLIKLKGGKCLTKYENSTKKIQIECFYKHEFLMSWAAIRQGQWCPTCSKSISERICRKYFEDIFGHIFPSTRPNWLLSDKGRKLELDGYCAKLNVAFEHNGMQHYKNIFGTEEQFRRLQLNDTVKIDLCKKNNVALIIIPDLFAITKLSNLKEFIKQECIRLAVPLPDNFNLISVDTNKCYYDIAINTNKYKYTLEEVQLAAIANNGKCLSEFYNPQEMTFVCKENHIWSVPPNGLLSNNHWCDVCAHTKHQKYSLNDLNDIAIQKGGRCLSEKYDPYKMIFLCKENHIWSTSPYSILRGGWCQKCQLNELHINNKKNNNCSQNSESPV